MYRFKPLSRLPQGGEAFALETKHCFGKSINLSTDQPPSHIVPVAGFGKGGGDRSNGHADYITNESKSVCYPFVRFAKRSTEGRPVDLSGFLKPDCLA